MIAAHNVGAPTPAAAIGSVDGLTWSGTRDLNLGHTVQNRRHVTGP